MPGAQIGAWTRSHAAETERIRGRGMPFYDVPSSFLSMIAILPVPRANG